MAEFTDTDRDALVSDSPYSITVAAVTKPCLFFDADEVAMQQAGGGGGQIIGSTFAQVKTSDFPNVKGNDACSITFTPPDGSPASTVNYTVWQKLRTPDGWTELYLRKA